jgi:hypothetical protein
LHSGSEELFVRCFALTAVLPEGEEHLGKRPASPEEGVSFFSKLAALLHQAVAERDIEVQSAFTEGFGEVAVMRVEEMVV